MEAGSPEEGWVGREAVPFSRTFNMSSLIVKFSSAPAGKGRGMWDKAGIVNVFSCRN